MVTLKLKSYNSGAATATLWINGEYKIPFEHEDCEFELQEGNYTFGLTKNKSTKGTPIVLVEDSKYEVEVKTNWWLYSFLTLLLLVFIVGGFILIFTPSDILIGNKAIRYLVLIFIFPIIYLMLNITRSVKVSKID